MTKRQNPIGSNFPTLAEQKDSISYRLALANVDGAGNLPDDDDLPVDPILPEKDPQVESEPEKRPIDHPDTGRELLPLPDREEETVSKPLDDPKQPRPEHPESASLSERVMVAVVAAGAFALTRFVRRRFKGGLGGVAAHVVPALFTIVAYRALGLKR